MWFLRLILKPFWGPFFEIQSSPKSAQKIEIEIYTENIMVLRPQSGLPPAGKDPGRVLFLKMQVLGEM